MTSKDPVSHISRLDLLHLLASRLERLSADSRWAHQASGVRGNILKVLEESEIGQVSSSRLDLLIDRSFEILRRAAGDVPDLEDVLKKFHKE